MPDTIIEKAIQKHIAENKPSINRYSNSLAVAAMVGAESQFFFSLSSLPLSAKFTLSTIAGTMAGYATYSGRAKVEGYTPTPTDKMNIIAASALASASGVLSMHINCVNADNITNNLSPWGAASLGGAVSGTAALLLPKKEKNRDTASPSELLKELVKFPLLGSMLHGLVPAAGMYAASYLTSEVYCGNLGHCDSSHSPFTPDMALRYMSQYQFPLLTGIGAAAAAAAASGAAGHFLAKRYYAQEGFHNYLYMGAERNRLLDIRNNELTGGILLTLTKVKGINFEPLDKNRPSLAPFLNAMPLELYQYMNEYLGVVGLLEDHKKQSKIINLAKNGGIPHFSLPNARLQPYGDMEMLGAIYSASKKGIIDSIYHHFPEIAAGDTLLIRARGGRIGLPAELIPADDQQALNFIARAASIPIDTIYADPIKGPDKALAAHIREGRIHGFLDNSEESNKFILSLIQDHINSIDPEYPGINKAETAVLLQRARKGKILGLPANAIDPIHDAQALEAIRHAANTGTIDAIYADPVKGPHKAFISNKQEGFGIPPRFLDIVAITTLLQRAREGKITNLAANAIDPVNDGQALEAIHHAANAGTIDAIYADPVKGPQKALIDDAREGNIPGFLDTDDRLIKAIKDANSSIIHFSISSKDQVSHFVDTVFAQSATAEQMSQALPVINTILARENQPNFTLENINNRANFKGDLIQAINLKYHDKADKWKVFLLDAKAQAQNLPNDHPINIYPIEMSIDSIAQNTLLLRAREGKVPHLPADILPENNERAIALIQGIASIDKIYADPLRGPRKALISHARQGLIDGFPTEDERVINAIRDAASKGLIDRSYRSIDNAGRAALLKRAREGKIAGLDLHNIDTTNDGFVLAEIQTAANAGTINAIYRSLPVARKRALADEARDGAIVGLPNPMPEIEVAAFVVASARKGIIAPAYGKIAEIPTTKVTHVSDIAWHYRTEAIEDERTIKAITDAGLIHRSYQSIDNAGRAVLLERALADNAREMLIVVPPMHSQAASDNRSLLSTNDDIETGIPMSWRGNNSFTKEQNVQQSTGEFSYALTRTESFTDLEAGRRSTGPTSTSHIR